MKQNILEKLSQIFSKLPKPFKKSFAKPMKFLYKTKKCAFFLRFFLPFYALFFFLWKKCTSRRMRANAICIHKVVRCAQFFFSSKKEQDFVEKNEKTQELFEILSVFFLK